MGKVTFTVSTAETLKTYEFGNVTDKWYENGVVQEDGNKMLDKFEMVKITIPKSGDISLPDIGPNARFTVEVKPDIGAALPINRIAPPDFQAGHYYEVY
jgi:flagellin FlaB